MTWINAAAGAAVSALVWPVSALPPLAVLAVVSLLTAVGMLLVFRRTSDQARLAQVKRAMHAGFFELRLFNRDLRAILAAQAGILRQNLAYLRLSLVPLLWMIVPITLLVGQLHFRFGYAPLAPGDTTLVSVRLDEAWTAANGDRVDELVRVEATTGLELETPPVWIPSLGEATWRLRVNAPGPQAVTVGVGDAVVTKAIEPGGRLAPRSPVKPSSRLVDQILYPAEAPVPDGNAIDAIAVRYPAREIDVLGWRLHWMIVYFGLSMLFALMLRRRFHVTI